MKHDLIIFPIDFESKSIISEFKINSVKKINGKSEGNILFINNNVLDFTDSKFDFEKIRIVNRQIKKLSNLILFFRLHILNIFIVTPINNIYEKGGNIMRYSKELKTYEILDMADGEKLERWGKYILIRPDPQIIWKEKKNPALWKQAHARYIRSQKGGGHWEVLKKIPASWDISYKDLKFNIKPMGFKHTGLFPEQSTNWDYIISKISDEKKNKKEINVLNLFAYTGGATVAAAYAGANVCHVDSSQGMTNWAKENLVSSGLKSRKVRFLVDDVIKFVKREIRRNNKYDIIIMDPPSYGRGKNGEVWNIEKDLYELLNLCNQILSDTPIFVLINTYTGGLSGTIIKNVGSLAFKDKRIKKIDFDEIGIKQKDSEIFLPCGITTIIEFK